MPAARREADTAFTQPGARRGGRGASQCRAACGPWTAEVACLLKRAGRGAGSARQRSGTNIIADQVEEHRRREAQRVAAVEDTAMAFNGNAKILDANVALDGAHHQSAA